MFKLNSSVASRSRSLAFVGKSLGKGIGRCIVKSVGERIGLVAAALIVTAFATGCGQKGPLTLPKPLPATSTPASQVTQTPGAASSPTSSPASSASPSAAPALTG